MPTTYRSKITCDLPILTCSRALGAPVHRRHDELDWTAGECDATRDSHRGKTGSFELIDEEIHFCDSGDFSSVSWSGP